MKLFKRLQPLPSKKQTDDIFFQKLDFSMKTLVSCFTEISNRLSLTKNQQAPSISKSPRLDHERIQSSFSSNLEQIKGLDNRKNINEVRKQDRFRNVVVQIPKISNEDKEAETTQILNWIGVVCKQVLSIGFLMFKNGQLEVNKIKGYCSENILRNLLQFARLNKLTQQQIQKINQSLRDEIFPYFCLKYPQSQEAEVNLSLASELVESNNIDENSNDLVYKSGIKFKLQKSGNYNTQIMQFINYIIKAPNAQTNYKSDQTSEQLTLAEKFNRDMEKIFRKVETQANVLNMKKFDPKNPTIIPESQLAQKQQSQKEKQSYLEKVRSYTSYHIGRKLSQNFREFTENQIKSGNLRLKNSSIMRVITKWCEELWGYFSEEEILNRETQFRMKNGSQRFMKKFFVSVLNQLLQRQKKIILKKLQQIQQNNYEQQTLFVKQDIKSQLKKFTQQEALVGQFTTVMHKNYENYLINYLNLLIHGLNKAVEDFQRFAKVEIQKDWVLTDYRDNSQYTPVNEEIVKQIMAKVEDEGEIKRNISQTVPQLISFRIGDLLRCKCSSRQTEITAMYKQFQRISFTNPSLLKIVRVKNRLDRGNRDILMNLMYKQQLLVEVQLSIKFQKSKFITCSNQFNHFLYELRRAQFGPISQMCSIWINQDPRSSYYLNFFQKTNLRKKRKNEEKPQSPEICCNDKENLETVRLPFICKICQCFYYHCSFTEKHSFCKKCKKVTCFLCQLESYAAPQIKQVLPELTVGDSFSSLTFLKKLPATGGAILNLKSKIQEVKLFKTIFYNNQYLLFENANASEKDKQIKIRLIQAFKSEKIPQSFLKQNIVYTSPEIEARLPQITDLMAQQQYFIPKYFKQSQKASKSSVTQIGNNLSEQLFMKNAQINWPNAKKINFSQNKFKNIDILFDKFPNIRLAVLTHNKIQRIPKQCQRWKNIHVLLITHNLISEIDPNVRHWRELVQLDLYQNKLKQLPEQFCQLEKLTTLNLDCNALKKLPKDFGKLKNLEHLNVSNNHLDSLPESFGNLKSLKILKMFNNYPISQLPSSFGDLTSLQHFNAFQCEFKSLPESFGNLKNLKYLNLQKNKLTELCESFGNLELLKEFNGECNKISRLPNNLAGLKALQNLNLYENCVEYIPESFGELASLKKADFIGNKIQKLPSSIGKLRKLQQLMLSDNKLKQLNENVCQIQSLKVLFLDGNEIQTIPTSITGLINLQGLGLDKNKINDQGLPDSIKTMKSLIGLGFSNLKLTTFPKFILQMTWLKQLNLSENEIKEIPNQILNLKRLAYFLIREDILSSESVETLKNLKKICKENAIKFFEERMAEKEKQQQQAQ